MRKLVCGIIDFRQKVLPGYREVFARLALGQAPDTLFIACSDSRVVPNLFASSNPGDLFVVRNVGNLVPPADVEGLNVGEDSVGAAIEFAVMQLQVSDIVVCGHSECGAMQALCSGTVDPAMRHLGRWLAYGRDPVQKMRQGVSLDPDLSLHNQLSQINVLEQIEHVKTYPCVRNRLAAQSLRIHGWWFDIARADVYAFEAEEGRFLLIDETEAQRILAKLDLTLSENAAAEAMGV